MILVFHLNLRAVGIRVTVALGILHLLVMAPVLLVETGLVRLVLVELLILDLIFEVGVDCFGVHPLKPGIVVDHLRRAEAVFDQHRVNGVVGSQLPEPPHTPLPPRIVGERRVHRPVGQCKTELVEAQRFQIVVVELEPRPVAEKGADVVVSGEFQTAGQRAEVGVFHQKLRLGPGDLFIQHDRIPGPQRLRQQVGELLHPCAERFGVVHHHPGTLEVLYDHHRELALQIDAVAQQIVDLLLRRV